MSYKEISDFEKQVLKTIQAFGIVKGKILAEYFGYKDTRTVRNAIQQLRTKGYPICIGQGGGYFFSTNEYEVLCTMGELLSRAEELKIVAKGMSRGIVRRTTG